VAAVAENGVIGIADALPWHLPTDMRHFRELTTGHTIVMGRRTFETLPRPLPNRRNVVVTRDRAYQARGALVVYDLDEAISLAPNDDEVFVVGGGEIYKQAMPRADRLYLTVVHADLEGDTFFPKFTEADWILKEDIHNEADESHSYSFSFRLYERRTL
jgi:dihydrofolate reductase